ncbi:MAG: DUF418 domain-containing protein, partial [Tannerellaceae bacterium]
ARGDYVSRDISFWVKTFVACFVSAFVLYTAKSAATAPLQTVFTMWFNLAFSGMLVSIFVILYQSEAFKKMTDGLRYYGKMSLTNYVSQFIIGSLIFFPYALNLADKIGIAWSLVIGILVMIAQIYACKYWLKSHKQGPLEHLWHKLTWFK